VCRSERMTRTDSSCCQQPWQPDEIVSCGLEDKRPLDALQAAQVGLRHAADLLDSAIGFLDPFADGLAERVARMPGRRCIEIGPAMAGDVAGHVRRHPHPGTVKLSGLRLGGAGVVKYLSRMESIQNRGGF
jgi:hypothetical protein